jgi:hypothetical protein
MATTRQHDRLTHPAIDFYVDVTVHERDGRHMATGDLAEGTCDIRPPVTRRDRPSGPR